MERYADSADVEQLVEHVNERHKREADEFQYGPPPEYPVPSYDRQQSQQMDAVMGKVAEGSNALLGIKDQGPTMLERAPGMLNAAGRAMTPFLRPGDRPPAIPDISGIPGVHDVGLAADALTNLAGHVAVNAAGPLFMLGKQLGLPEQWIEATKTALESIANVAGPTGAVNKTTGAMETGMEFLGKTGMAVERGVKTAGKPLTALGERGGGLPIGPSDATMGALRGQTGAVNVQKFVPSGNVVQDAVNYHNMAQKAGSTFNPRTGENMAGQAEYAVGILSDLPQRSMKIPGAQLTPEAYQQFLTQNADVLSNPSTKVGSWYNKDANETVLDVVVTVKDRASATVLGKRYKQEGIFDLSSIDPATGQLVPGKPGTINLTRGKGQPTESLPGAQARVRGAEGMDAKSAAMRQQTSDAYIVEGSPVTRADMAKAAENQPWWYDSQKIQAKYGEDTKPFLGMVAATSANRNVEVNLNNAEKAYSKWVAMGKPSGEELLKMKPGDLAREFGVQRDEGQRIANALAGKPITIEDVKLQNFHRALLGDHNAVVLDLWMGRAYGIDPKRFGDPHLYEVVADMVRSEAKGLGLTPRQYQERIWVGLKYLTEKKMPPSLGDAVIMSPAERAQFLRVARSKPDASTRHTLYVLGSMMLGDQLAGQQQGEI